MELSLLREHVSEVLGAECNLDRIRRNAGEEGRFEKDFRALVGELGWVAMCVPQELGGLGYGLAASCIMIEEGGAALAPESLMTLLVAAPLLSRHVPGRIRDRYLPLALTGELKVGIDAMLAGPSRMNDRVLLGPRDADIVFLAIEPGPGEPSGLLLVEGSDGLSLSAAQAWDPTRTLSLADVGTIRTTRLEQSARRSAVETFALLTASDSLGAWNAICRRTVEYLGIRQQFGRQLGSFQALKHRLADMYADRHLKSALVEAALEDVLEEAEQSAPWALLAKAEATDGATLAAAECLQLHGGIGFTWEHECHLFLKRARLNQSLIRDNAKIRLDFGRVCTTSSPGILRQEEAARAVA